MSELRGPISTSYWPLAALCRVRIPREAASVRKRLNLLNPIDFSLKLWSSSSITCLKRSERITSLRSFIFLIALAARTQGSCFSVGMSAAAVRPDRLV
jgi:hypothetical protein